MKASEINLKESLVFNPDEGKLAFGSQRMVLFSTLALRSLMTELMDIGGIQLTTVVMRLFGESAGREDARVLKEEFDPASELDWLAMGPTLHTWEGVVKATPTHLEYDRAANTFLFEGTWENSYFAEQFVSEYGPQAKAVCWPLVGYATGYVSTFFGAPVVCREAMCVALGDPHCKFVLRTPAEWEAEDERQRGGR